MRSSLTPFGSIMTALSIGIILTVLLFAYTLLPVDVHSKLTQNIHMTKPITIAQPKPQQLTLGFVGDIMMHSPMTNAMRSDTGAYDFTTMFRNIIDTTSKPDIMIGNLETPVTGDGTPSGYPNFDAPVELLDALQIAGFDALQVTNNHSLDQGSSGLEKTLQNITARNLIAIGGTMFPSGAYQPLMQVQNGITIGIIAATYGFNGYTLPANQEHLANSIDEQKLASAISNARTQGADIVIVMPHFGVEYERTPNEVQKKLVDTLFTSGADAIIGTHPHVPQPVEKRILRDGRTVIVAYSLGNFISNQQDKYTDLELFLSLTYERDLLTKKVTLKSAEQVPLYLNKYTDENNKKHFEVVQLKNASRLLYLTAEDRARIADYQKELTQIIEIDQTQEKTDPPTPTEQLPTVSTQDKVP